MGRAVVWTIAVIAGVIAAGWLALTVVAALFGGFLTYLLVGLLVVGGGVYLYRRVRRSVAPGTRNQRRIEAAVRTYRARNR